MPAPWERYGGQSNGGIRYIPGPPVDPEEQERERLARENAALQAANSRANLGQAPLDAQIKALGIDAARRAPAEKAFDNEASFRKEFSARPEVANYGTILPQYTSAIQAGNNKAGDLNLVNAFAKILDPNSVVREGEVAMASSVGGAKEQIKGYLAAITGKGGLTPDQRAEIMGEIRTRGSQAADAYNLTRRNYTGMAQEYGIPSSRIVGPHLATPYQQVEANFLQRPVRNLDNTAGAVPNTGNYQEILRSTLSDPRLPPEQRLSAARQVAQRFGRPFDEAQALNAIRTGAPIRFEEDPSLAQPSQGQGGGLINSLAQSFQNTAAGVGQGLASLPDAAATAVGATLGVAADAIPGVPEWVSDRLKNPFTIGGAIERASPTSQAPGGQVARFGAQLLGGFAGTPQSLVNNVVNRVAGQVPAGFAGVTRPPASVEAAQAARDLGVRMPRFVAGGPTSQRLASAAEQTPFGAPIIGRATETMINDAQRARDVLASRVGEAGELETAGEAAIRGGSNFLTQSGARADRLYGRAEKLTGDVRIPLNNAKAALDQQIAELADTPGVVPQMLNTLTSLRGRIDGEWTPASIRRMRTILSNQFVDAGMQPGDASRRARMVVDAAEDDMVAGLRAAGKGGAAKAWQDASKFYRTRAQQIEETLAPILGANNDKTGAEVARSLMSNARGNGPRLANFLKEIPAEEAGSIRASIINQLGRSNAGQQNAAGDAFSLDTFLTHWDQLKSSRNLIFDPETRAGLNMLAQVADRAKAAGRTRNNSNTGTPIAAIATAVPGISGATAFAMGSPAAAATGFLAMAAGALAQSGGARLLASPGFARKLAQTPASAVAAQRFWSSPWVRQMARANPAVANDLDTFQQSILQGLNSNVVTRAAASPDAERDQYGYSR